VVEVVVYLVYRGRMGNQMMYMKSAFTNSKPIVKYYREQDIDTYIKLMGFNDPISYPNQRYTTLVTVDTADSSNK
jgi:hypothetical protein